MIRNSVEETKLEISEGFAIPFLVFILSRVIQEKRDCSLGSFFEKSFSKNQKSLGNGRILALGCLTACLDFKVRSSRKQPATPVRIRAVPSSQQEDLIRNEEEE